MLELAEKKWNEFWFQADGTEQFNVFRRFFAVLIFFVVLYRTPDLATFYSKQGLLPESILSGFPEAQFRISILRTFDSFALVWFCHLGFLSCLALLVLDFFPRWAAFGAFFFHLTFLNRNPAVVYGVDTITGFYLFFLCFADYRDAGKRVAGDWRSILGSAAYRLSQIQICLIYGYSGLGKVRGISWWKGEALWYVVTNPQYSNFDFSWVAHYPFLLMVATYSSLIWEVYFPALVWVKPIRYPVLVFGVLLHLGIIFAMGLTSFGILMMVLYLLFLDKADAVKIAQCVKKISTHRKVFLRKSDQIIV